MKAGAKDALELGKDTQLSKKLNHNLFPFKVRTHLSHTLFCKDSITSIYIKKIPS